MTQCKRKITKEMYGRAVQNGGQLTREDYWNVFNESDVMGYGVYNERLAEEEGNYYVTFNRGSSAD